eukprot:2805606-Amphidinium_carterae.1
MAATATAATTTTTGTTASESLDPLRCSPDYACRSDHNYAPVNNLFQMMRKVSVSVTMGLHECCSKIDVWLGG